MTNVYKATYRTYISNMEQLRGVVSDMMADIEGSSYVSKVLTNVVDMIDNTIFMSEDESVWPGGALHEIAYSLQQCRPLLLDKFVRSSHHWHDSFVLVKKSADVLLNISDDVNSLHASEIALIELNKQ